MAQQWWTIHESGVCPECGKCTELLNLGRSYVGTCDDHLLFWFILPREGVWFLVPAPNEDSEEVCRCNAALLQGYKHVKPIYPAMPPMPSTQR